MEIIITIPTNKSLEDLINLTKHLTSIRLRYEIRDMNRVCITEAANGATVNLKDLIYVLNEYKVLDLTEVE
jgi:hypothetical protein